MKCKVVVFPGSNCDHDCFDVVKNVIGLEVEFVWHKDASVGDCDFLILPGGFSYGDYLRCGSIARFSPIMDDVVRFANAGKPVIGICNGFQILLEAGLLPGAMLKNQSLRFICQDSLIKAANYNTPFTNKIAKDSVLHVPIAHGDGNYYCDDDTLNLLQDNEQVIFQYCDADGNITDKANPNGSRLNIAGICNKKKNVLGMMPHPERSSEKILGSADGKVIFESIVNFLS